MIMNEKHANKTDGNVKCSRCENLFHKERKWQQHYRITNCHKILSTQPVELKPPNTQRALWNHLCINEENAKNMKFEENVSSIYENIVYWKRNIFRLPTGKSGRCFIDETTRLIDVWIKGSLLKISH